VKGAGWRAWTFTPLISAISALIHNFTFMAGLTHNIIRDMNVQEQS
jgi:hypothetical protein